MSLKLNDWFSLIIHALPINKIIFFWKWACYGSEYVMMCDVTDPIDLIMKLCSDGYFILCIEIMQTYLRIRLCNSICHGFQSVSAYIFSNLCLWLQSVNVKLFAVSGEFPALRCVPCCYRKEKPADEADGPTPSKKMKSDKEDAIKEQNKLMYEYRDQLKKEVRKQWLEHLLKHNDQHVPSGEERVCIAFCYLCVSQTICVTNCRLVFLYLLRLTDLFYII